MRSDRVDVNRGGMVMVGWVSSMRKGAGSLSKKVHRGRREQRSGREGSNQVGVG